MQFEYTPHGVCSRKIYFEIEDNTITSIQFEGGCSGNTQGVAALAVDMDVDEAISRLSGIRCGGRSTSCPDQLAKALAKAKEQL
ncbi:MAG: TIGR03905 family TSCPD domain-containing protein [Firmicutes bacterium]|nr:TIGR03905 family TSCPD domain-containing protein [Bacillota bacterium]MDY2719619.1 TIGR03905 family TSCPD domain-containing protein [Candidatus Faecousia sp.]